MLALRPGVEELRTDGRAWVHRDVFAVKPRGAGFGEAKSGLEGCLPSQAWMLRSALDGPNPLNASSRPDLARDRLKPLWLGW